MSRSFQCFRRVRVQGGVVCRMGHKEVSRQLNKVMRLLLGDQNVERTTPDKPNNCLQKYRLITKGAPILYDCGK